MRSGLLSGSHSSLVSEETPMVCRCHSEMCDPSLSVSIPLSVSGSEWGPPSSPSVESARATPLKILLCRIRLGQELLMYWRTLVSYSSTPAR